MIRFRTGDLSFLIGERCECGRYSPRLGPILARKQQMMKVKGTSIYPPAIASALASMPEVIEHYVEVRSRDALSEQIVVHVCVTDDALDPVRIGDRLQACLRVRPDVVVEPEEDVRRHVFSPKYRKPMRFLDRRRHEP